MPLTPEQIARALADPAYRASLSDQDRAALPPHPAGGAELSDENLDAVAGGAAGDQTVVADSCRMATWGCCPVDDP